MCTTVKITTKVLYLDKGTGGARGSPEEGGTRIQSYWEIFKKKKKKTRIGELNEEKVGAKGEWRI